MNTNLEKDVLPSTISQTKLNQSSNKSAKLTAVLLVAALGFGCYFSNVFKVDISWNRGNAEACPQVDVLVPDANRPLWDSLSSIYGTEDFKARAVDWLGGAVRVPTESFDDLGPVGEDPRWDAFAPFHSYLLDAFPRVHSVLQLTKVNTYGLLYVWPGSNDSLKPILLAAHQDVVPVDPSTVSEWTHPPYSGYFDGESVWGRGSSDDKSGLIGVLSSIESLLEGDFRPSRTVVLAFGFDEEVSGERGAHELSKALLNLYGEDGIAFVVDEGGGFTEQYGSVFATPGIAEKGYLDVQVEVTTAGGHSSVPPKHTSIGILAALLVHYEANPTRARLTRKDPLYSMFQCVAEHSKDLPSPYRKVIKHAAHSEAALYTLQKILFQKDRMYESLVGTTQAIDMIHGGVKANALPERASAIVNHRIAVISSVAETKSHDTKLVKHLARRFNLTLNAFGEQISEAGAPSSGTLTLSDAFDTAIEPAPVTPTGKDAAPYRLLSGTIKAAYNSHRKLEGNDHIFVSPSMPSGNTDTRFYWNLTRHIYRYNHHNSGKSKNRLVGGVHTVNEHIGIDVFLEKIRFFTTLILNADEATIL